MKDESKKIDVSRREAAQWGEINFKVVFSILYPCDFTYFEESDSKAQAIFHLILF